MTTHVVLDSTSGLHGSCIDSIFLIIHHLDFSSTTMSSKQVSPERTKAENLQFWGLIAISAAFLCGAACAGFSRDEHNLLPTVVFAQLLCYCFSASQLDNHDNVFFVFAHVPLFAAFDIYVNWWFGGWHLFWVVVGLALLYRSKSISKKLPHRQLRDIAKLNKPTAAPVERVEKTVKKTNRKKKN